MIIHAKKGIRAKQTFSHIPFFALFQADEWQECQVSQRFSLCWQETASAAQFHILSLKNVTIETTLNELYDNFSIHQTLFV